MDERSSHSRDIIRLLILPTMALNIFSGILSTERLYIIYFGHFYFFFYRCPNISVVFLGNNPFPIDMYAMPVWS